jgi:3-oxoadipate enol-lactonase
MTSVQSNGVRLSVVREGSGPTVVLLHGYLFGARWWRPQIDALSDRFDVVAVDLRGQGGSEAPDSGYDHWTQAEDIHGVIQELGLAPAHLVGLSMGGFIAMRLALAHPEDVRSLVLLDTSAAPEVPEARERDEAMYSVVEAGDLDAVLPALPPIFFADDFIVEHRDVVDRWLEGLRGADVAGLVRAGRGNDARDDIRPRLAEIRVPALVIHGTEDVPIPVERGREIAAGIDGARFETVSGGHQSNVDRPEDTSRLIREFLLSLEDSGSGSA